LPDLERYITPPAVRAASAAIGNRPTWERDTAARLAIAAALPHVLREYKRQHPEEIAALNATRAQIERRVNPTPGAATLVIAAFAQLLDHATQERQP
jgi:hypothetical protein